MGSIPSNFPPSYGASNLGDSPNSIDQDPAFIQLVDAAWEAMEEYQNNPSDINVQTVMQTVNALSTYLSKNVPTSENNPDAYDILQALNAAPPGGSSLATYCQTYDTSNCQATVQYFESEKLGGTDLFAALFAQFKPFGSVYQDRSKTDIETDIYNLQNTIDLYNYYMKQTKRDPQELSQLLTDIAQDIAQFTKDASTDKITDGYLTLISTFLNTPVTAATGALSLQSLSANLLLNNPPKQSDLDALQQALLTLGVGTGKDTNSDLVNLLNFSIGKEYPS